MRPHRLEVTAFGAFAGSETLDLDQLAAGGLVLFCGETGGGKTTLLDAIGFALYGVVPGMRGKAKDLRSHHTAQNPAAQNPAAQDRTSVRLEFSVGGGRFRATRSPGYDRPAKRGGGTTREQPSALLERRDEDRWVPVAQRLDDVGHEIGLLVGMSADQFFQVILLPQGRFADFLHAEHEERERLLKRLFHVDRFERAERWLADRAREAAERVGAGQIELARVAARVAQVAGVDEPTDAEGTEGWVEGLTAAAELVRADAADALVGHAAARTAAETALADARTLARRQADRRAAEGELAGLAAEAVAIGAVRVEVDAARRAGPAAVALEAVAERAAALAGSEAAEQAARTRLAALDDARASGRVSGAGTRDRVATPAELAQRGRAARTEIGRLETLVLVAASAEEEEKAATDGWAEAEDHAHAAAQADQILTAALPDLRAEMERRLAAARTAEETLPWLRDRSRMAAELAHTLREWEAATEQAARAAQAAATLRARARQLRQQRFEAVTAELAAALADDSPCPVCGSLFHPDPTEASADHVSKDVELEAEADAADADREASELRRDGDRLTERVRGLRDQLVADGRSAGASERPPGTDQFAAQLQDLLTADVPSAGALERQAALLASGAERLTVLTQDVSAAAAALTRIAEEEKRMTALSAGREADARNARQRATEAAARAAQHRDRLNRELGDGIDALAATDRLSRAELRAAAYEQAADAATAASAARAEHRRAADTAQARAREAGFSGADEAAGAGRDPGWIETAAARLDAHRDALAAVHARLATPDLAVEPEPPAPVADREAAAELAAQTHESAVADARRAADRAAQIGELAPRFGAAREALTPLREAAAELRGLADLAAGRGDNRLGMPLASFVLAARLEEVAAAASTRLRTMTGGRFSLVYDATARPDKRRRAGLGLLVEDAWTARRRDTATLSGGETFQAALSLALGLADVVTAESGGSAIDALFVDEGFGTLDPESLEEVMNVLDELRSGGRLVGVVSHVAELRQRIPTQVHVIKGASGSTVRSTV